MNRRVAGSILATVVLAFGNAPSVESQQSALSLDLRGAYGVPFGDFGDNVEGDFGFGAGAVLSLTPSIGIYGGWAKNSFDCTNILCASDSRVHVSGLEVGAKLVIPAEGSILPWLKAGLIAHKAEFDGAILNFESDRQIGFQAAVGADLPLGEVLSVSPSLRLDLLDIDDDDFFDDPEARYFSVDLGVHIHIPRN